MVRSPRTILSACLTGLLAAGLSAPAPARADSAAPAKVTSPWDEEDDEIENAPCSPEDRQRAVALLVASVLLRSPYETTPPVLPPPPPKVSDQPPGGGTDTPPGDTPPPDTQHAPEPATLLTGAVGSGLALLTWLRGRRRGPEAAAA
jgi:hypothetical protein